MKCCGDMILAIVLCGSGSECEESVETEWGRFVRHLKRENLKRGEQGGEVR